MKKVVGLLVALVLVLGSMSVNEKVFACESNSLLDEIVQLAKEGKVKGSPFIVGTEVKSVHKEWGVPNSEVIDDTFMGKSYHFYADKQVGYKADATNTIVKSLLYKPEHGVGLNLPQVEEYMGTPDSQSVFSVTYGVGGHNLTFFYQAHRVSEYMFVKSVVVSKKGKF